MANAAEAAEGSNGHEGGSGGGGGGGGASVGGAAGGGRPPRLPRWTRQEILVLIQGKRVVESRGSRRRGFGVSPASAVAGSPTEPKWASVSTYCRRHGVNRGPVQCRKRWSNLASDYKKIKEWEAKGKESFWAMRNDLRRERRLPGFFDREVFDILEGTAEASAAVAAEEDEDDEEEKESGSLKSEQATRAENEEATATAAAAVAVFDSGRTAAEDGLFSDFEEEKEAEEEDEEETAPTVAALGALLPPVVAVPISEKNCETTHQESSDQAAAKPANPEKETHSHEGQKRRRTSQEDAGDINLQSQLIEVLDRNSKLLAAQLEAHNVNCQLDRDQRKEQAASMLNVLGKLADAMGKIADKL